MEHSVFRDYCKAENSEDEEVNHDLQSRLYAEVYYTSNSMENVNTKTNIKIETPGIDSEELLNTTSTSKASISNNKFTKNGVSKNRTKICVTNDAMDNSMLFERENKSNIRSLYDPNEIELLHVDDKNNLNVSCIEIVQHPQESIDSSKCNKESVAYHKVESIKNNPHLHNTYDISEDVHVKSEIKVENTEELKSTEPLNSEKNTTTNQSSCLNSRKCNVDNNVDKMQEEMCTKQKVNDSSNNILKRYEFSKLFINKLYLEKYDNLNRQLQELEEKEIFLREKEQEKINIRDDEENRQQLDTHTNFVVQKEDTKYGILTRNEKIQETCNYSEEVTLLSSEMESDSEESILEVPIPPKPQPVVIQLQDSDEGSETFSSDRDMDDECLFVMDNINNSTKNNEKLTYMTKKGSDNNLVMTTPINDTVVTCVTEDIVLNCTEIQKGASSIKEIKEMNKNIWNKDKDKIPDFQLPLETINNSNVVYERDKNKSVSFADDIVVANFQNSNESSSSRKRRCENDSESCTNVKQKKNTDIESKYSETCSNQHKSKDKQESWEEYFFRPMSDNLKAFYNESQGQENFDIEEIQSKMSKDPRLWAILDEDLMPHLSKHKRFWNMKCNKCHCEDHQTHNCPQLVKLLRCHMCGAQGHTETQCPQKMCLTCGKKQGTFRKTCESCRTLYCNMCKAVGHKSTECPDLWRRFHQTTRNSEINVPENLSEIMKPADLLYCCNCTKRGHDSSTCYEYRWSQHFPTPAYVSNYGNRTGCEDLIHINTNEDIIPLSRGKKSKSGRTRNVIFSQGNGDLEGCCILYSYGAFHTKKQNGDEILKEVKNDLISNVENFLKGCIPALFLDQLAKIIKFEIKIFQNPQKVLMIRIRSFMGMSAHVHRIFIYWLQLQDDEKHLDIHINLPRGMKKLLKLLTTKWEELEQQDSQDPNNLCSQIEQLKMSMASTQNSFTLSKMSEELLDLRRKLMKIYHTKPLLSREAIKLRKMIRKLKKSCDITSQKMKEVTISWYMQIINVYNKIFVPRTLAKDELECFFKKYYKEKIPAKNKGKENETTKKLNAYEQFIQNLRDYNKLKINTQDKQTSSNINNSTTHSLKVTQKHDKQTPTVTSTATKYSAASNSIQSDDSVTNFNTENVYTERHNWEDNIADYNHVYPIEVVQLPRNVKIASNKPVENTVKTFQKSTISPNLISLPLNKFICSNTSSKNVKNDQLTSVPCTEIKSSEGNIEKHVKVIKDNSEIIKVSDSQQKDTVNSETNVTKKKRSKKVKKAKPNFETSSQLAENEVISVDVSIENEAKKVISDALGFNLPYMNKAVEEVEKRINDKSINQEHIDVLQRLIALEKDHQKYVSSFCNYLK